jgi:hypothetical protein
MGDRMNRIKLLYASSVAASATIIFSVAITMLAEWSPALKNDLKQLSGHHWTSKSLLVFLVYFGTMALIYYTTREPDPKWLRKTLVAVSILAVAGYVALLVFFLEHYL